MLTHQKIAEAIEDAGLSMRGGFTLAREERVGELAPYVTIALVGMVGELNWPAFAASPEFSDGAPHPLDRWSRRVIGALAARLDAGALFPFGGPPYWPFQRWAARAEAVFSSPLGMFIHPEYGLFHSYRGALAFREPVSFPERAAVASPCESCATRPCLSACPVGAFSESGYDVPACVGHLKAPAGRDCMSHGCRARRACPVGRAYGPEPASFHMRAFLRACG